MSYSHAADGLLAPTLQSALQRFAKPWWKRQALRIFRDESSLSASPHLWSSITAALDSSRWLMLLLSPDAARSEWVNKEIEYWTRRYETSRILPVVTDGEFIWRDGDVGGDAVPPALRGVFTEEPRWVDLRGIDRKDQVHLKNPRFAAVVADLASAIHGVPKDELASEEVRQHRRTMQTAWATGVLLILLTITSVGASILSNQNAVEAEAARFEAEREEERAVSAEADAVAQAERARASEAAALEQAALAEARRLAREAELVVGHDQELAMLLVLEALAADPGDSMSNELIVNLRYAMLENRLLLRLPAAVGRHYAGLSPTGATVYHSNPDEGALRAIDIESGDLEWEYPAASESVVSQVGVRRDGRLVSVAVNGIGAPARIVILDARTGAVLGEFQPGECDEVMLSADGFSPDGRFFSVTTGSERCGDRDLPDADWGVVYDTATWQSVFEYRVDGALRERVMFSGDSTRVLWANNDVPEHQLNLLVPGLEVRNSARSDLVFRHVGGHWATLDPTGGVIAYDLTGSDGDLVPRIELVGLSDAELIELTFEEAEATTGGDTRFSDDVIEPFSFSPDGSLFAVVASRRASVFDVATGDELQRFVYRAPAYDHAWSVDGSQLLTAHEDGLRLWTIAPDPARYAEVIASSDWEGLAVEMLTRGLTAGECSQYDINPCLSLEEIRSR